MSTTTAVTIQPGHVGLNVTDLDRSLAFYTRVLDLQPLGRSEDTDREWVFLGRDGQVLLTLWRQSDGIFDATRPGLHHLALRRLPDQLIPRRFDQLRGFLHNLPLGRRR